MQPAIPAGLRPVEGAAPPVDEFSRRLQRLLLTRIHPHAPRRQAGGEQRPARSRQTAEEFPGAGGRRHTPGRR